MKYWIDTDIGGDIDDALALLLAMAEDLEIAGVSTVFENTAARAKIAKTILTLGGYGSVPVYAGIGKPRKAVSVFGEAVDTEKLPKTYVESEFGCAEYQSGSAIEGLKAAIELYGGELSVVTMGALTNIAGFIEKYPRSAEKISCLYIMGAARELNLNEFNVTCDPEAADIVFSSNVNKKIVTLDCTFKCELNEEQISRFKSFKSAAVKTVARMCGMWGGGMILHDPLALAAGLRADFVEFVPGNLKVELNGEYSRGKCVDLNDFNWKMPGREDMLVSKDVDSAAFIEHYLEKVAQLDKKLLDA